MTVHISRDYAPATSGYAANRPIVPFIYGLSVFLRKVLGYSIVGHYGWDIDLTNRSLTVTNATNATPIVVTTSTPHDLSTGHSVSITGVGGNSAANGTWIISVTGANTFNLIGSSGNGAYTSGGTVSAGLLYTFGLVADGYGAGINFGAGVEKEVSIPAAKRTVIAGDIGKMLVIKSTSFPTKNSGCFKITGINAGANRYIIDYRSTENPPVENTNTIDWWLYEVETAAGNHISSFTNSSGFGLSNATNTTPIVITSNFGFADGSKVEIVGVGGNTAANGIWTITPLSATTFSLNGSIGNGAYTGGGIMRLAGYPSDETTQVSRIILQSPHPSGWQVRLCVESFNSNLPPVSVAVGFGGNSIGDFPVGGQHTHLPLWNDIAPVVVTTYNSFVTGGGNYATPSRMTIVGDSSGQYITLYTRSTGATNNGIIVFGIPDNEPVPLPTNNIERLFCYGGQTNIGGTQDFGQIIFKIQNSMNIGNAYRNGLPEFCALTGWANLDGTTATSPLLSANAGDSPFTNTTEVLPVEIWGATYSHPDMALSTNYPLSINPRLIGTAPMLRIGRTNFGNFTLTTDEVTSRTVTAATNTSPIQITTSATNALTTGQIVTIHGVNGNTAANGTWVITVINNTNFTLNGSVGNGTYTSGGTVNGTPRWLHLQNGIYLQWNGPSGLTP